MAATDVDLIAAMRKKIGDNLYYLDDDDEPADECVHFYFLIQQHGKEVICDCVLYTLRLHHEGEMHELAEARAAEKFDAYIKSKGLTEAPEQEEELGMLMAEILLELEEEEAVKVSEHVEEDDENSIGLGIDAGLNVEVISKEIIERFIADFRAGSLKLDDGLYSFQTLSDS